MVEEVIRFNTWRAFYRALERVENNYGDKQIHGQIYMPQHRGFKSWSAFHKVVAIIKKYPHDPKCNRNEGCHGHSNIFGIIHVEITDVWDEGRA